ncbi:MAG: hypothetical protein K9N07_03095 [Candidatus Cloacimonetes bacterium]|nr:hypothetical protein [Candidatus Cloacimonadota bacterium]
MIFKHARCPVCKLKVSFLWNYFSIIQTPYTCPNCKTRFKWHSISRVYVGIAVVIMFSIYHILDAYTEFPFYMSLIIGFIPAQLIFMLFPKKVKIICKE